MTNCTARVAMVRPMSRLSRRIDNDEQRDQLVMSKATLGP